MKRTQKSQKRTKFLFILIILTAILSITATYAWFSTQRDVEIVGMRLNVEVAESMQISLDGKTWVQSINIADMRQFYGSYTKTGYEGFAVYQANPITSTDGNSNYVPTELLPVSTTGRVAGGKLQFVQGTVTTAATGTTSLTGITACSETDLDTVTTSISNRETATIGTKSANETHPFLVFDMYLRNVSARAAGADPAFDPLLLDAGSRVWINDASTDDGEQEGAGVTGTGLEYSSRVGFVIYGSTLDLTAEGDASNPVDKQVRSLAATGTEKAVIWEPNDLNHTQYVVNNNGRGISGTSQAVTTYAITGGVTSITDVNEDTDGDANLIAPETMKPAYTLAGGVTTATELTDVDGNAAGIMPNKISRVRVYVWLEGQDPDCIDMASTGDKLNVTIKLDREENSGTTNTYTN